MSKKRVKTGLILSAFILLVYSINCVTDGNVVKREIQYEYKGIVVGDTALRKNTAPFHLIIQTKKGKMNEYVSEEIRNYVNINDSIIKPAHENKLIITRKGETREFKYRNLRGKE